MPISATGAIEPRRIPAGYTLIEVLVVVSIAAIVTALILLRFAPMGRGAAEASIQSFGTALEQWCDQALYAGRLHGMQVSARGYRRWVATSTGWQPDSELTAWPEDARARFRIDGRDGLWTEREGPQIVCDGLMPPTAFSLELEAAGSRAELRWPP
ncbi:MAG: hypothetical protein Kow0020_10350 [Wenzhouxiangellaceae bacterium]